MVIRNNEFFNVPTATVAVVGGRVEHDYFAGSGYSRGAHANAVRVNCIVAPVPIWEN